VRRPADLLILGLPCARWPPRRRMRQVLFLHKSFIVESLVPDGIQVWFSW
jgi:hypothetical protein